MFEYHVCVGKQNDEPKLEDLVNAKLVEGWTVYGPPWHNSSISRDCQAVMREIEVKETNGKRSIQFP